MFVSFMKTKFYTYNILKKESYHWQSCQRNKYFNKVYVVFHTYMFSQFFDSCMICPFFYKLSKSGNPVIKYCHIKEIRQTFQKQMMHFFIKLR